MKKLPIFLLTLLLAATFVTPIAHAQPIKNEIQESRSERQENAEKRSSTRCSIVTNKIDITTNRYEQNKIRYVKRYNKLISDLEKLVDILENSNVDTLNLPSQIDSLKNKVDIFNTQIENSINLLNESKNFACGESAGDYKSKVIEARNEMEKARLTAVSINNYISDTIKPEIEEIKKQSKD